MAKSKIMYIIDNDFEGAKDRLEQSNNRWRAYWFDCCSTIFNNCKNLAKTYILDPINLIVIKIAKVIKKKQSEKPTTSHTYLIKMFDDCGKWVFTKIGKADIINKRMSGLKRTTYKKQNVQIGDIEIIKTYELPNDDLAQVLESFMRNYFRTTKTDKEFFPNDRFEAFEPTQKDFEVFEQYYNLTVANAVAL